MNYLDITKIESSQLQDIDRLVALKDEEVKIIDKESITQDTDSKIETHNSDSNSHKELFDSAYKAIDTVADKLEEESNARQAKDSELASNITSVSDSLKEESETRASKDTELTNLLANEATSRMEDITSLNKALTAETEARTSKDTEIEAKINGLNIRNGYGVNSLAANENGVNAAYGERSSAFGGGCLAREDCSFAEGFGTQARGNSSHSEGFLTITSTTGGHSQGRRNEDDTDLLDSVGIGYYDQTTQAEVRKNAEATYLDGRKYVINVGGYDGTKASIANGAKDLATVLSESGGESNVVIYDVTLDAFPTLGGDSISITPSWTFDDFKALKEAGKIPVIRFTAPGGSRIGSETTESVCIVPNVMDSGRIELSQVVYNNNLLGIKQVDTTTLQMVYNPITSSSFSEDIFVDVTTTIPGQPTTMNTGYETSITYKTIKDIIDSHHIPRVTVSIKNTYVQYVVYFLDSAGVYGFGSLTDNYNVGLIKMYVQTQDDDSRYNVMLWGYDELYAYDLYVATSLKKNDVNVPNETEVNTLISTHNTATDSHSDIRDLINSQIAVFDFTLDSYPSEHQTITIDRASVLAAKTANKLVVFRFKVGEDYNYMFPTINSVGGCSGVFIYQTNYYVLNYVDSDEHIFGPQPIAISTEEWTFTLEDGSTVTKKIFIA